MGQILLAMRMGKTRIIAETGAGQHGVAAATVCARFGLECVVYMGTEDMRRQAMNVHRMRLLGADVREVAVGSATLKDATSEAIRDWVTNVGSTHYIIGSAVGPHPYPAMVRDLQRVIGDEARDQYLLAEGRLPEVVMACVGGGSHAIGMFTDFIYGPEGGQVGVVAPGVGLVSGRQAQHPSAGAATRTWRRLRSSIPLTEVIERSRLEVAVRATGNLRLIPYLMAGHPSPAESIALGRAYARAGAAAVEVGVPHSDPLADGPVIQRAGQLALDAGMTMAGALEPDCAIAGEGSPVRLMTSLNPVLAPSPPPV